MDCITKPDGIIASDCIITVKWLCDVSVDCQAYSFSFITRVDTAEPRRFANDDEAISLPTGLPCETAGRVPPNRRGSAAAAVDAALAAPVHLTCQAT